MTHNAQFSSGRGREAAGPLGIRPYGIVQVPVFTQPESLPNGSSVR